MPWLLHEEGGSGHRRAAAALAAAAVLGPLVGGAGADAVAAEPRGYEMVSPPQKSNGGVVFGQRAADDGESVAFIMNAATGPRDGAYALAPYVSHRSPTGWSTLGGAPPIKTEHRAVGEVGAYMRDATPDFGTVFLYSNDKIAPGDLEPMASGAVAEGWDMYRFRPDTQQADWMSRPQPSRVADYKAGGGPTGTTYLGRSLDGRHVVFMSSRQMTDDAPATDWTIYESVDGDVRQVSILPDGQPAQVNTNGPFAEAPLWSRTPGSSLISEDGSRILWTTSSGELYLRAGGATTVAVSASQRAGTVGQIASNIRYLGMTPDAGEIFFSSGVQLTDDAPVGIGAYRYDSDSGLLTYLAESGIPTAPTRSYRPAVAESGERLYFFSQTAVAPGAVAGRDNLYVVDGSGVRLVASTTANFSAVDPLLRATADGDYAVFTSMDSIGPEFDAVHRSGISQIYRYVAASGDIECISCRQDGEPTEGAAELRSGTSRYAVLAAPELAEPRNVLEDGTVHFQTTESLVPRDSNGTVDVYEYQDGVRRLISTGRGTGSELIDSSADGSSVFFTTPDALVPTDIDGGYPDVYVARVGGGFPIAPPPQRCEGDNCQGAPTAPPVIGIPGSELVDPDGTADDPEPREAGFRPLKPTAAQLRSFARSGRIALRVRVDSPGSVLLAARGRVGRRQRDFGRAWSTASKRGTLRITVPLNRTARTQLSRSRRLRVTVVVRHTGASEARQIAFTLRRPAASKRGGRR